MRIGRAERQVRTRAAVLAAAKDEFADHGYAEATVDRVAERAGLTRGAVYANFPSKRALYLAVLLDLGDHAGAAEDSGAGDLSSFARVWLERLPLTSDSAGEARLRLRSLAGVFDTAAGPGDAAAAERAALVGVARLEALLLALALERTGAGGRLVRVAEVVRSLLDGVCHQAEVAPGGGDPFDVVRACEHLAGLDLGDVWAPPHREFVAPAGRDGRAWEPPEPFGDLVGGEPVDLWRWDGLIVVLGTGRLGAVEEAVRSGLPVTVVVVSERPAELGALVRLRVADVAGCLRRAGFEGTPFRLLVDDDGSVAGALRVAVDEQAEVAVRVRGQHMVARAEGRGAALGFGGRG